MAGFPNQGGGQDNRIEKAAQGFQSLQKDGQSGSHRSARQTSSFLNLSSSFVDIIQKGLHR